MPSILKPLRYPTKAQALSSQLLEMAHELGPEGKFPTILELCDTLEVSLTTLNSALVDLEAQRAIYRKRGVGIFVSPQLLKKCVGVVCEPEFFRFGTSPFWPELIESMRMRASINGETFRFYMVLPSPQSGVPVPEDLIQDIRSKRLNGVLFVGNNAAAADWLDKQGMPSVVFAGVGQWKVRISARRLVKLGVGELKNRGCRKIGLLKSWLPSEPAEKPLYSDEAESLHQVLEMQGLPFHSELLWEARALSQGDEHRRVLTVPDTAQEQGYQALMTLFGGHYPRPDGLIVMDDMMTRGVLAAARQLGLKLGQDLHIATHANKGASVLNDYRRELILMEVDTVEIVNAMFSTLEGLMAGREPEENTIWIEPMLVS